MVKCPDCEEKYVGETGRRLQVRANEHAGKDRNSHVYKHSLMNRHTTVTIDDFTILDHGYKSNYNRKIAESLYIKNEKPSLNAQVMSVPLKLFN